MQRSIFGFHSIVVCKIGLHMVCMKMDKVQIEFGQPHWKKYLLKMSQMKTKKSVQIHSRCGGTCYCREQSQ